MRLVSNVVRLPGTELADVADAAQGFANAIADGDLRLRQAIIVTVDPDGYVDFACIGEQPGTAEAIGLLELAKARIVAGSFK